MPTPTKPIQVAAGVLRDGELILIAQRKAGKYLAGYWEFPGGKIEPNETPQACLVREFKEEFGIDITVGDYITEHTHDYGDKLIHLTSYFVIRKSGIITLYDHAAIKWLLPKQLEQVKLSPADIPTASQLKIWSFKKQ